MNRVILLSLLLLAGCGKYEDVERFSTTLSMNPAFGEVINREVVVVIEQNESGRERAYVLDATSKTWVEAEWVRGILLENKEK